MKDLGKCSNTIANALQNRIDELTASSVNELRSQIINILNTSDIKDVNAKQKFIDILNKQTNYTKLLSTVTTYMTGMKVASL